MAAKAETKEPDDIIDSDAESVCSTVSASSSYSGEKRTKLFVKFPPFVDTKQLYDHFSSNGFDESEIYIHRHINKATSKPIGSATVFSTSQGEDVIAKLNGTMILGKHKLIVQPYQQQSQNRIKKQSSFVSAKPSIVPEMADNGNMSPTDSYQVFVGIGLPKYINEQHIREHFHEFNHLITKVDTIRDKRTNASKGNFVVTFQTEPYASMAIQKLNKSLLLGEHKLKVERHKFQPNLVSSPNIPALHGVVIDNLDPTISIDEIKALVGVPIVKHTSFGSNSHQLYLQFHNQHDSFIAIQNLNGKNLLGKVVHAYPQNQCMPHPPNVNPILYHQQSTLQQQPLPTLTHHPSSPYFHRDDCPRSDHPPPMPQALACTPLSGNLSQDNYHPAPPLQPPGFEKHDNHNDSYQSCMSQPKGPTPSLLVLDCPPNNQPNAGALYPAQTLCYPVKVTRLPKTATEETLHDLFRQAGEVLGRPAIHITEQPYAHVNFKQEFEAQNAVQRFNGTVFHGRELKVSVQKPKPFNKSTVSTTPTASLDRSTNEVPPELFRESASAEAVKIINLDTRQWNKLMTMRSDGTSQYQRIVSPFQENPNVKIEIQMDSFTIRISGVPEAVSRAFEHINSYLYEDLQVVERTIMEALVEIHPNLPDVIREKYGVIMTEFNKETAVLHFDGPTSAKVSAWTEVYDLFSSAQISTFDISFSVHLVPSLRKRLQIDKCQTYLKMCKAPPQLTLCSFNKSEHQQAVKLVHSQPFESFVNVSPSVIEEIQHFKSLVEDTFVYVVRSEKDTSKLLVRGFCMDDVKKARAKLISLVKEISEKRKMTSEEILYLKYGCENHPDQFSDVQIKRKKGNVEILGDPDRIKGHLSGLMCKRYQFKRRFQQQITCIILRPLKEERNLDFVYILEQCSQLKRISKQKPASKMEEEHFQVVVCSKDLTSFDQVCASLNDIKPTSEYYRFRYHDSVQAVKLIKSKLETAYHVCIVEKERWAYINGLKPDNVQKCREVIDEEIRSKVVIVKTISNVAMHELRYLKRKHGDEFEHEYNCKVYFIKDRGEIQIKGKIKDVEALEGRVKELTEMGIFIETFPISCNVKHFAMWKKRWMSIKKEQEESEIVMDFYRRDRRRSSNSSNMESEQEMEVTFEIIGPDADQLFEIKEMLCREETEKRVIDVSAAGATALLNAKRQGQLNFMDRLAVDMHIDKRMNKIMLQSPQGLAEDLETAELEIQEFVGIHASVHKNVTSEEPIVGLVLSSKTKSVPYLATANSFAKAHKVAVHTLRPPLVGLRLIGNSAAIEKVQEFMQTHVIKQIEGNVKEEELSISHKYSTLLNSPEFTRFESKLKQDFCVICSYPKHGQQSKAVHSALIQSSSSSLPVRVDIHRGDIVQEKVDAIVNAANMDLNHIGGLAKAISDAGGSSIQSQSNSYVANNGKVLTGNCVALSAGALPCKRVIHAVGPRWKDGNKGEEEALYFTVYNCLQCADEEKINSIAFPAISTGVFRMPEDVCARASLKAVLNYLQTSQDSKVTAIRFVLYTQTAFQAFKSSFKSIILPCATKQSNKDAVLKSAAALSDSGQWLWSNDSGSFSFYSPAVASQLTQEYHKNPNGSFQCLINGQSYKIDFAAMIQTNISTGNQRKLQFESSAAANHTVQWQYTNDQHSWSLYQPNESQTIESMYQASSPGNLKIVGKVYTFDFTTMHQINSQTGYKRSIRRVLLPTATIVAAEQQPREKTLKQGTTDRFSDDAKDFSTQKELTVVLRGPGDSLQEAKVKFECKLKFMLKTHNILFPIDMEEKLHQIIARCRVISFIKEVERDTKGKYSKQQKQVCLEGTASNVQRAVTAIQEGIIQHQLESEMENEEEYPQEWDDQAKTTQVFLIQQGSPEWNRVDQLFKTTMPTSTVIQISRIQNKWLWERYAFQRKRLGIKNAGNVNERELFHGTRSNDPRVIYENEDGFDMRYSAQGMWGQANYFAVNASYSHNYAHPTPDGAREMFLVKVLTGDSYDCPSNSSLRKPPMKATGSSGDVSFAQVQYDTVTGVTSGSRVYMIYDNDKAYPAYLVKYK